ncbi:hypothetical protein SDRG_16083, partial [Saprolegnia diclina VS20]
MRRRSHCPRKLHLPLASGRQSRASRRTRSRVAPAESHLRSSSIAMYVPKWQRRLYTALGTSVLIFVVAALLVFLTSTSSGAGHIDASAPGGVPSPTTAAPQVSVQGTIVEPSVVPTPAPTTPTPSTSRAFEARTAQPPGTYRFINYCNGTAQNALYWRWLNAPDHVAPLPYGASIDFKFSDVGTSAMARLGASVDATLFEFNWDGARVWYDLSVVPVACGSSWDLCAPGTHSSFNVPVSVEVFGVVEPSCVSAYCANATCPSIYQVPNSHKTHDCGPLTRFVVTFCYV